MKLAVVLVGLLIASIGLASLVTPSALRRISHRFLVREGLVFASVFRLVVGALLVLAAPQTRVPALVLAFGVLLIAAGVAVPFVGISRIRAMADWWLERPDGVLRGWALVTGALGAFLVWAAI